MAIIAFFGAQIFRTVAGVLHLGNVDFKRTPTNGNDPAALDPATDDNLGFAAELLGIDPAGLADRLLTLNLTIRDQGTNWTQDHSGHVCACCGMCGLSGGRCASRGLSSRCVAVITKPLSTTDAVVNRDAMAKHVYTALFNYIVSRINEELWLPGARAADLKVCILYIHLFC